MTPSAGVDGDDTEAVPANGFAIAERAIRDGVAALEVNCGGGVLAAVGVLLGPMGGNSCVCRRGWRRNLARVGGGNDVSCSSARAELVGWGWSCSESLRAVGLDLEEGMTGVLVRRWDTCDELPSYFPTKSRTDIPGMPCLRPQAAERYEADRQRGT